jgi:hypothetical protein
LPVNHTGKIDKPAVVAEIQAEIRAELARAGENR